MTEIFVARSNLRSYGTAGRKIVDLALLAGAVAMVGFFVLSGIVW